MYRLMEHCSEKVLATPFAVKSELSQFDAVSNDAYQNLLTWAQKHMAQAIPETPAFGVGKFYELQGPTGESNQYIILPRHRVLSIANDERGQLQQLLAVFAVGSSAAVLKDNMFLAKHQASLPKEVLAAIKVISNVETDQFDAVLHHGSVEQLTDLQNKIANRSGAIVGITHLQTDEQIPLERLVIERAISVNTAAAGGNASLMTLSED